MMCVMCGEGQMVSRRENHRYVESGLPYVTLVAVEKLKCEACGEDELVLPHIEDLHRLITSIVISKPKRLTKEEIRFLRKQLGWSGDVFAKHMGVTAETVSRWEHGKKDMGAVADRLLRVAVALGTPIESYPVDRLATVGTGVGPVRTRIRPSPQGWTCETAAPA